MQQIWLREAEVAEAAEAAEPLHAINVGKIVRYYADKSSHDTVKEAEQWRKYALLNRM
jgi:hypothetical protein